MIILSVATAIVISSAALAGINQGQSIYARLENDVKLGIGGGAAGNVQFATAKNDNFAVNAPAAWAVQGQSALLGQGAGTIGVANAHITQAMQTGGAIGTVQGQSIGNGTGPKSQGQNTELGAGQEITKGLGIGVAVAGQGAMVNQGQASGNARGIMSESSGVTIGQLGGIAGMGNGHIVGGIAVVTIQNQSAN
jgi:hypothetical protein